MNAALRRRHRTMVIAAAVAASTLLLTALAARAPVVYDRELNLYGNNLPADTVLIASNNLSIGAAVVKTRLYADGDAKLASYLAIGKVENRQSAGPDVLVYWQPDASQDRLDPDARLLGPLVQRRDSHFVLPEPSRRGYLVFYSLAHQRVLSAHPLAQLYEEK